MVLKHKFKLQDSLKFFLIFVDNHNKNVKEIFGLHVPDDNLKG